VKDLCQRALEREPRDRAAFLAEVCQGDHELQRNVETLLMQETEGEGILELVARICDPPSAAEI
jgi:hypothetical protein